MDGRSLRWCWSACCARSSTTRAWICRCDGLFELLGDIREMLMLFPPQGRGGEATVRTSITALSPEQRSLYDALALERYASR